MPGQTGPGCHASMGSKSQDNTILRRFLADLRRFSYMRYRLEERRGHGLTGVSDAPTSSTSRRKGFRALTDSIHKLDAEAGSGLQQNHATRRRNGGTSLGVACQN